MKKAIRVLAAVLCVVMIASAFYGCTIKVNVNLTDDGSSSGGSVAVDNTVAPSAATTAAPAPSTTAAPAADTTAAPAADTTAAPTADTTAAPAADTTAAPAADAAPSTTEEIVAEYAKVYNTTKAAGTFKGHDTMVCEYVKVDGSEVSAIKSLADSLLTANGTDMPLPPYSDDNPSMECLITAADVQEATYKDNGDGTATIKIVPKEAVNSKKFQDSQGKMFNVMEDVASALASVKQITWSEGDANSNTTLTTKDGYAEVTYDKETKMMTKADYVLVTYADVVHANVFFFKDKAASLKCVYTMSYPG